jgi:hypothetical protein
VPTITVLVQRPPGLLKSDANISFPLGSRLARLQSRLLKWVIRIGATATGFEA